MSDLTYPLLDVAQIGADRFEGIQLEMKAEERFYCGICYEEKPCQEQIIMVDCHHQFCKTCME